jgi:hypothetical protein
MAASARRSWQKGDGVDHFFGLEEWWAVLLAFAVAILGPIIILVG